MCSLVVVTKLRALDNGMSSFLSDTYYYSPCETINASSLTSITRWSRGIPWVVATKIGSLDECKCSLLGGSGALEHGKVRVQRWHLLVFAPRECSGRVLNVCIKLNACPSGLCFNISKWLLHLKSGHDQLSLRWVLGRWVWEYQPFKTLFSNCYRFVSLRIWTLVVLNF